MNNYFYPRFTSMWQNPTNINALGNITKKGINWSGILRGRALNLNEDGNPGDLKMYSIIASDID